MRHLRKPLVPRKTWEVIDVETASVLYATTEEARDAFVKAVEVVGHRVIVHENSGRYGHV